MTNPIDELAIAECLALRLHSNQSDKSGAPYCEHCRRVVAQLEDPTAKIVAWLHDVLEDTEMCEGELRHQFGGTIADAVVALTRIDGQDSKHYYERVRANELTLQVKLADIYDNLDPIRLAKLDTPTRERLVIKYERALELLLS